jgi:hypothetical protein
MPGAEDARPPGAAVGNELNNLSFYYFKYPGKFGV